MAAERKSRVRVARAIDVPDPLKIERSLRAPELGPKILFFSGGSALRSTSRVLKRYTHNSVHLITPFDSGGSSARLREAFGMLSVGDLRNRLIALADETVTGNPEIYALFSSRLAQDRGPLELGRQLEAMVEGSDPLVAAVPEPMRRIVRTHLRYFAKKMPPSFDLRGASVGNLILVGGFLANDRDIDSVIFTFSRLVKVRGLVRPLVTDDLHLRAGYESGATVVGQHRITGKEVPPPDDTIRSIGLVHGLDAEEPARAAIDEQTRELIAGADLICFPMGSFFTSVLANLLADGVGAAIARASCPKVYVPSTGEDPEQRGLSLERCVEQLIAVMREDAGQDVPTSRLLDFVLVDGEAGAYASPVTPQALTALGVTPIDLPLASANKPGRLDAEQLVRALISLA